MIVNKTELSEIFGVSQTTLTEWQKAGMPYKKGANTSAGNTYNTAACIAWRRDSLLSADDHGLYRERARLTKEQADAKAMDNAANREGMLKADDVDEVWKRECKRIRTRLLAIGPKVAPLMIGVMTPNEAQRIIETIVHETLTELSKPATY